MLHVTVNFSILLSLSLLLLINLPFYPVVLSGIFLLILICRYWCFKQGKLLAKKWTYSLLIAALIAIYLRYSTFIGVDAGVAVLATFLFAKSLETKSSRDALILFNFALFVTASSFLSSQSIGMAIGVMIVLMSCLTGLYRLQTSYFITGVKRSSFKQDIGQIMRVVMYATPFFILLFLFFPRLPPLWHIPIPDQKGITGMSDQMSPGDLAELSQSSELAFRIIADMQQLPPRSQLYWRAMVLDHYDGKTWTGHNFNQREQPIKTAMVEKFHYQYLAADPRVTWIMGLEQSIPKERRYFLRRDGGIMAYRQHMRSQPIQLVWLANTLDQTIDPRVQQRFFQHHTQHIATLDHQAQQLAQELFVQAQHDPIRYIELVLTWYKQQNFIYSLEPGVLGQHRVDEFLFKSQKGFCEHYASSFAMLLRYVGIPARIVLGYQGGQLAPDAKSWEVRQLDAHAWTEVYINQQWQRFDPTAIIAPARIDNGMQGYLEQDQQLWSGTKQGWNYQQFQALKHIRIWSDYLGYQWQSKIIGYDATTQYQWLSKFGLHSSYSLVLLLSLGLISLLGTYFTWIYLKDRAMISAYDRALQQFSKDLDITSQKQQAETVPQWMQRLAQQVNQDQQQYFYQVAHLDQLQRYADLEQAVDLAEFKNLLKKCAIALREE